MIRNIFFLNKISHDYFSLISNFDCSFFDGRKNAIISAIEFKVIKIQAGIGLSNSAHIGAKTESKRDEKLAIPAEVARIWNGKIMSSVYEHW